MIKSTRLTTTINTPVFYSTDDGTLGGDPQQSAITTLIICNTAAGDPINEATGSATVSINLVPSGGGASDSNAIIKNLTVPAEETVFLSEERIVLGGGDFISATASVANRITITVSSLKV